MVEWLFRWAMTRLGGWKPLEPFWIINCTLDIPAFRFAPWWRMEYIQDLSQWLVSPIQSLPSALEVPPPPPSRLPSSGFCFIVCGLYNDKLLEIGVWSTFRIYHNGWYLQFNFFLLPLSPPPPPPFWVWSMTGCRDVARKCQDRLFGLWKWRRYVTCFRRYWGQHIFKG